MTSLYDYTYPIHVSSFHSSFHILTTSISHPSSMYHHAAFHPRTLEPCASFHFTIHPRFNIQSATIFSLFIFHHRFQCYFMIIFIDTHPFFCNPAFVCDSFQIKLRPGAENHHPRCHIPLRHVGVRLSMGLLSLTAMLGIWTLPITRTLTQ